MPFDSTPVPTSSVYELLLAAHNLIRDPQHWCQGTAHLSATDDHPESWCASGAIGHAMRLVNLPETGLARAMIVGRAIKLLLQVCGVKFDGLLPNVSLVAMYNDTRPHAAVMAAFEAAEQLALNEENVHAV